MGCWQTRRKAARQRIIGAAVAGIKQLSSLKNACCGITKMDSRRPENRVGPEGFPSQRADSWKQQLKIIPDYLMPRSLDCSFMGWNILRYFLNALGCGQLSKMGQEEEP
ncbi:MAG: hypothetical protein P0Y53_20650 [Candidatus Pseudobacter hemicellulosilyticus]|uniref:Uncharacterized protein n=1 Tax=Candidatus Pseudobacter hemicellulosilyticus TaxID=3121375 RepID=A0AAJ5WUZ4_9BACT|nr:MAG: hypothetical protein P0Y53_20650 [Pseudobacter sp.]